MYHKPEVYIAIRRPFDLAWREFLKAHNLPYESPDAVFQRRKVEIADKVASLAHAPSPGSGKWTREFMKTPWKQPNLTKDDGVLDMPVAQIKRICLEWLEANMHGGKGTRRGRRETGSTTAARALLGIAKTLLASRNFKDIRRSDMDKLFGGKAKYNANKEYGFETWYGLCDAKGEFNGKWLYLIFSKKSTYPITWGAFDSETKCKGKAEEWIDLAVRRIKQKSKHKGELRNPFEVGDILDSSIGIFHNGNFYKVKKVTDKGVYVVKVESIFDKNRRKYIPGDEIGSPFFRQITINSRYPGVMISPREFAECHTKKPRFESLEEMAKYYNGEDWETSY